MVYGVYIYAYKAQQKVKKKFEESNCIHSSLK